MQGQNPTSFISTRKNPAEAGDEDFHMLNVACRPLVLLTILTI